VPPNSGRGLQFLFGALRMLKHYLFLLNSNTKNGLSMRFIYRAAPLEGMFIPRLLIREKLKPDTLNLFIGMVI
jgi:hypothetical protein